MWLMNEADSIRLLLRAVFILGSKVDIWKQAREQVIMIEPKFTDALHLLEEEVTLGDICCYLRRED
jgi:hypothetical protein